MGRPETQVVAAVRAASNASVKEATSNAIGVECPPSSEAPPRVLLDGDATDAMDGIGGGVGSVPACAGRADAVVAEQVEVGRAVGHDGGAGAD